MLSSVVVNLVWIIFAYLLGSLNFSIILTKFNTNKQNIKEVGSGNAGATNAMRAYGFKFGLLVFFLDASKAFWLGFTMGLLQNSIDQFSSLIPQLSLLFVIIGHIFPIYFKFKGGKGAATLLGMISSISLILAAIGTVLFLAIVFTTKYVSLGSIVVPYILAALAFICPYFNHVDTVIWYGAFWINPLFLFIGSIIVASSHWQNIMRLMNGTERKTTFKSIGIKFKNKNDKDDEQKGQNQPNKSTMKPSNNSLLDQASDSSRF